MDDEIDPFQPPAKDPLEGFNIPDDAPEEIKEMLRSLAKSAPAGFSIGADVIKISATGDQTQRKLRWWQKFTNHEHIHSTEEDFEATNRVMDKLGEEIKELDESDSPLLAPLLIKEYGFGANMAEVVDLLMGRMLQVSFESVFDHHGVIRLVSETDLAERVAGSLQMAFLLGMRLERGSHGPG